DKVPGADVMRQVAEELAAEWIITEVLDETTAVSVGVGLPQLGGGGCREAFQEQRLDLVLPKYIDQFLVSEQRVSRAGPGHADQQASQQKHPGPLGDRQPH